MINAIKRKYGLWRGELDERGRRRWAATEASELGHGGMVAVARATGLSERTIRRGYQELQNPLSSVGPLTGRRRCPGGGRSALRAHDPQLLAALEALVEPTTRGDPMSPLRWTWKSTRKLAKALTGQGHRISHTTVAHLLAALDYRLQGTRKTQEGDSHPDRDAQFRYINQPVKGFQQAGQPVISGDAKKQE
jgi:DNA-binding phage protein